MNYTKFRDIPQITQANYKINIPWHYIEDWIESNSSDKLEVILEPEFQRAHVWTEAQRVKYIEWCLRGGRSGNEILWNCAGWMKDWKGPLYLVDGLQRITSVRMFMQNKLRVFGSVFSDFSDKLDWIRTGFVFYVNDLDSYADVLQWYLDINDGGTVHTQEEINKVRNMLKKERECQK
jgi:hypothetical protein